MTATQRVQVLLAAAVAGLILIGPPGGHGVTPSAVVVPEDIWAIVVEDSVHTTSDNDKTEAAIQRYCDTKQAGRYRRFDAETTRDRDGKIPAAYERFFSDYKASDRSRPRLTLVSVKTGATLWAGPLPATAADVETLLKRYGG